GRYALLARPDDFIGGGDSGGGYISEPGIIVISEGDATGVEVRGRPGASISGVGGIEGRTDPQTPAKLAQVKLTAYIRPTDPNMPAPMGRRPVRVNPDGSFHINGLQAGKAMIMIEPPPDMRGLTVGRIEYNGAPAPEGIEIDPGEQVTGVR